MADIPEQIAVVAHVRSAYPTPLGDTHGYFLLELARQIGKGLRQSVGLLKKDSGTRIVLPDGTTVAQDIICFPNGRIFDCLRDGENSAIPAWGEAKGSPVDLDRYYPVATGPMPVPDPKPDPPPVDPNPPPSADELVELWKQLHGLQEDILTLHQHCRDNATEAQAARTDAANAKQATDSLTARMDHLVVTGNTRGRGVAFFGSHYHEIPRLAVVDARTLPPEPPKG